jgi:hypothetical protein
MAYQATLPEMYKIVDATLGPVTTNGGVTLDYVSLKHAHKAWLVLQFTQAVGHATVVTLKEATAVAGTSVKTVINDHRIWSNEDTAATDTLVQQTDAKTYTLTNDIKKKMVVLEIDPDALDINAGFDVVGATISDSSQATNFVSGVWVLAERYKQATPPAAITN